MSKVYTKILIFKSQGMMYIKFYVFHKIKSTDSYVMIFYGYLKEKRIELKVR